MLPPPLADAFITGDTIDNQLAKALAALRTADAEGAFPTLYRRLTDIPPMTDSGKRLCPQRPHQFLRDDQRGTNVERAMHGPR